MQNFFMDIKINILKVQTWGLGSILWKESELILNHITMTVSRHSFLWEEKRKNPEKGNPKKTKF